MSDINGNDPAEATMRAMLADRAARVPSGAALAEQIIMGTATGGVSAGRARRDLRWRTWALPLVAAGAVAALAGALLISQNTGHDSAAPPAVARTGSPDTVVHGVPVSGPSPSGSATSATVPSTVTLTHFRILDVTFVGTVQGWALGTADCLSKPGQTCSALMHTSDGTTWTPLLGASTPFNVAGVNGCIAPCVSHIRFASAGTGYAYGPSAFFMTTNGGVSWKAEPGGADALETLDGNVIRITDSCLCSPGTTFRAELAAIGATTWQPVSLPGAAAGDSVLLSRTGAHAYLVVEQNPAGGAGSAQTTFFASADAGHTWSRRGEVCTQGGGVDGEVDTVGLTTAPDGSVTVLCQPRGGPDSPFTMTSTDDGATFTAGSRTALGSAPADLVGSASATTLFVMSDVLYRSTDAGVTWARVQQDSQGPLTASFVGFETPAVGRIVENPAAGSSPSTLWTTSDGGLTWTPHAFA